MVLLVVAPSFVLFGYCNGSTGGIATNLHFVKQFPKIDTVTTTGGQNAQNARVKGVVVGCYDLGAVVGSLLCIGYSDRIGRLKTILIGLILSIIALAIQASAFSLAQFVVGRLLIGAAIGAISASVPIWQAECSSTAHRGAFVVLEGVCISSGISLSEWVAFGLSFAPEGAAQWRVPLIFPVIFPFLVIPFVLMMPESPRWLARVGRLNEARTVLAVLNGEDEHSNAVNEEMNGIEHSLSLVKGKFNEIFTNGEERISHRTALACWGLMVQQMCGISALVFYTNTVFEDLNFHGVHARLLSTCLTTFQTCCSVAPLFLVDRVGRRTLFVIAGIGLSICSAIIAGTGSLKGSASVAATVFVFFYQFFYPFGFLGQTFLYATEVAPLRLRVPIMAIANATQWLSQFVVAQVTPPGTSNLGSHYWIIYAVLNAFFVVVFYIFFPETRGMSLEDMDEVFKNSRSIFDTVRVAKKMMASGLGHGLPRDGVVAVEEAESKSETGGSDSGALAGKEAGTVEMLEHEKKQ
ncbi:hypothetical protein VTK73DRAFT_3056 [Phialemonium thermophilum]|uniref:Major facilitator superfamily (MFS) profile domain-containing protein n=1 Tax=Phialemonium thermophilum TaxID=223376 RepID=A0ABR3X1W6_9PEZI